MAKLGVVHLPGLTDYAAALEWQRALAAARAESALAHDLLILLQHPPVVTLGRGARDEHLPGGAAALRARGVAVFEVERGGDVTYHGPGQLVGYPILALEEHRKDLHWYLRQVEEALIRACADFGVEAGRNPPYTGVWVGAEPRGDAAPPPSGAGTAPGRKIASIGVHVARWVTRHGFAWNVTTDLSGFELIVPCGIPQVDMTSLAKELGRAPEWDEVVEVVTRAFGSVFGLSPQAVAAHALPVSIPAA